MKGSSLLRIKPVTRALVATIIACGLVGTDLLWPGQLRSAVDQLKLPTELAKYKEWRNLLQSPAPVPLELWIRCVTATPTEWTQAREKYGPHTEHYIQVYANQIATQALHQGKAGVFLTGSVIAKEKLMDSPEGTVAGVAFMIKRGTRQFASTGGWEFAYYPRLATPQASRSVLPAIARPRPRTSSSGSIRPRAIRCVLLRPNLDETAYETKHRCCAAHAWSSSRLLGPRLTQEELATRMHNDNSCPRFTSKGSIQDTPQRVLQTVTNGEVPNPGRRHGFERHHRPQFWSDRHGQETS